MTRRLRAALLTAFLGACAPTPANDDAGASPDAPEPACGGTIEEIQSRVLVPTCGAAGCHGATAPASGLDLVSPGVEARLVGTASTTCPGRSLVVPGDPAASFFVEKLSSATPSCGSRMPLVGALDPALVACIADWVRALPVEVDAGPGRDAGPGSDAGPCPGLDECSGACVDLQSDPEHCGDCAMACDPGQRCVAGACAGCGSASTLSGQVQPIFDARCATMACHGGMRPAAGLSLVSGRSRAALVGVAASGCSDGRVRVEPSRPDRSYLVNKIEGVGMCFGNRMPLTGASLTASESELVQSWICRGALND